MIQTCVNIRSHTEEKKKVVQRACMSINIAINKRLEIIN
jgi:hypothetical protein